MTKYKTIEDVRFDERISDSDISAILDTLNEAGTGFENDVRTRLEHQLVGGSAAFKGPLTPFAYFAGMSVEDINKERASKVINGEPGEVSWGRGSNVTAPSEARNELYQKIHEILGKPLFQDVSLDLPELNSLYFEVRYKDKEVSQEQAEMLNLFEESGLGNLEFWFAMSPLDPETGKTGLPYVSRINVGDTNITDQEFLSQFKLKTPYEDSGARFYLRDVDPRIKAFVDEKGYKFEINENQRGE